jgi:thiol-disulfide isomerase/thioredoxin
MFPIYENTSKYGNSCYALVVVRADYYVMDDLGELRVCFFYSVIWYDAGTLPPCQKYNPIFICVHDVYQNQPLQQHQILCSK